MNDRPLKPDFISFYRSEWSREDSFIRCKDGRVFEQIHRDRYRLIYCILFIILAIAVFLFIIALPFETPKVVKYMTLLLLLLVCLYPIITYNISHYKLIDDVEAIKKLDELDEYEDEDQA